MFDSLSDKLDQIFKKLRGQGVMTEENIKDALREVRLVLLEADVNFKVVKDFVERVKNRAIGSQVLQSLAPGQQVIKIVHDELVSLMGGGEDNSLNLAAKPPVAIMLVGLQGSGKTTSCGKLAKYLKAQRRKPLLVPADVYRPAAIEQFSALSCPWKFSIPVPTRIRLISVERHCAMLPCRDSIPCSSIQPDACRSTKF